MVRICGVAVEVVVAVGWIVAVKTGVEVKAWVGVNEAGIGVRVGFHQLEPLELAHPVDPSVKIAATITNQKMDRFINPVCSSCCANYNRPSAN